MRPGHKCKTALHEAAKHKRLEVLRLLLNAKASLETPTTDKKSMRPLHYAARGNAKECIKELLMYGADPLATTHDGQTALSLSTQGSYAYRELERAIGDHLKRADGVNRFPSAELVAACKEGKAVRVKQLLEQAADPDSADSAMTALQCACAARHIDVILRLIDANAQPNLAAPSASVQRQRALHFAARVGPAASVELLLNASADPTLLCGNATLPIERTDTLHTRDRQQVRELLYDELVRRAVLAGHLRCLTADRKRVRSRFCLLLPRSEEVNPRCVATSQLASKVLPGTDDPPQAPQLLLFADENPNALLKMKIDLQQLERLRTPCVPPNSRPQGTWPIPTPHSFDMSTSSHTTVLFAQSDEEKVLWLDQLIALIGGETVARSQLGSTLGASGNLIATQRFGHGSSNVARFGTDYHSGAGPIRAQKVTVTDS